MGSYLNMHTPMRNRILRETETARERVWDALFPKIEREMVRQVAKWEKRFHKHKFRMALMHGGLMVFVDPPVMGDDMPAHIGSLYARGALLELQKEIEAFDDFLGDIDSLMGGAADGLDTKRTERN